MSYKIHLRPKVGKTYPVAGELGDTRNTATRAYKRMPRDAPEAVAGREAAPDCSGAIMLVEYLEAHPPLSFGSLALSDPIDHCTGLQRSEPGMNVSQLETCVFDPLDGADADVM
jgi:hypothetical protein